MLITKSILVVGKNMRLCLYIHKHTHSHAISLSLSHTHTHTNTHIHKDKHTGTQTNSLSLSLLSLSHANTQTHLYSLSPFFSLLIRTSEKKEFNFCPCKNDNDNFKKPDQMAVRSVYSLNWTSYFYFVSFSYNGMYFLWFIFNHTLGQSLNLGASSRNYYYYYFFFFFILVLLRRTSFLDTF